MNVLKLLAREAGTVIVPIGFIMVASFGASNVHNFLFLWSLHVESIEDR